MSEIQFQTIEERWGVKPWEDWFPKYQSHRNNINRHNAGVLVLPSALGGDDLARNQEFIENKRKIEELEDALDKERLVSALMRDAVKIKNDELREMQNQVMGLQTDLNNARKRIALQAEELANVKTDRLSLKAVGQGERILSSVECKVGDELGILRQTFLPKLPAQKTEPAAIQILGLYEGLAFEEILKIEDAPEEDIITSHQRGVAQEFSKSFFESYVTGGRNVATD